MYGELPIPPTRNAPFLLVEPTVAAPTNCTSDLFLGRSNATRSAHLFFLMRCKRRNHVCEKMRKTNFICIPIREGRYCRRRCVRMGREMIGENLGSKRRRPTLLLYSQLASIDLESREFKSTNSSSFNIICLSCPPGRNSSFIYSIRLSRTGWEVSPPQGFWRSPSDPVKRRGAIDEEVAREC